MIKVAITSIGSGVGQSIVDSCRNSQIPMKLYGLGMNPLGYGAFDCDVRLSLPSIYHEGYIDKLLSCCEKYKFDIVIPGLDDELILLSKRIKEFNALGVEIPVSSPELIELCRDKELMSRKLLKVSSAFVQSFEHDFIKNHRSDLKFPLIAKPNSGFASRDIFAINGIDDLALIKPFHVVQSIAVPKKGSPNRDVFLSSLKEGNILQVDEISIQILYDNDSKEIGRMVSFNKLQNGVPIEVIPIESDELWNDIDRLMPHLSCLGIKGPINIQGRFTDDGFKIFEMNPRFTGITGLRALMGFNEVEAIIKAFCLNKKIIHKLAINNRKIGIRQVTNRVIDVTRDAAVFEQVTKVTEYSKNAVKTLSVLVTGANGYLGLETVRQLIESPVVGKVNVLVRKSERFKVENTVFFPSDVTIYDVDELFTGELNLGSIDIVCHLAAGRSVHSEKEMAESLEFTNKLMLMIGKQHVPAVINISSQSVYGLSREPLWKETDPILPETAYAQSKWAGELMTRNARAINNITSTISLRLARFIGPSESMGFDVVPHIFAKKAIKQEAVIIQGGSQKFDYMDVKDAAKAIIKLIEIPHDTWPEVLNIGSGKQVSLLDIAKITSEVSEETSGNSLNYRLEHSDVKLELGMSIDKAKATLNWEPKIELKETITNIFNFLGSKRDDL